LIGGLADCTRGMTIATAYIRVSSRAQDHATQRAAIERVAAARGDVIAEWFAEKKSAKTMARAELHRLRTDAREGRISKLYLFRIDRLARSGIRDTFEVVEELRAHGVQIVTVAHGFDLAGPAAEVVLAVMAWAAQMERLAIGERISAARERIEAEGGRWGRPRRVDTPTLNRATAMRAAGRTIREIAVALKIPRSTIAGALASSEKPPSLRTENREGDLGVQRGVHG
jgi:DNA invertase Pin-like site-specific DNA recombinase